MEKAYVLAKRLKQVLPIKIVGGHIYIYPSGTGFKGRILVEISGLYYFL